MNKIIDIPGGQGSQAWHEHRRTHFNASDAPAMMGVSPYKTRSQLLRETHTGLTAEVSADTQRLFDSGHRFEALARPLAEAIVGEDLYPITVTNGRHSASLDGATLEGDVSFEHKRMNDALRDVLPVGDIGGPGIGVALPLHYRVQLAHQHYCSGAKRTLFMASNWTDDGTLIESRACWFEPDAALIEQVLAGWEQFAADLAAYVPPESAPAAVAAPVESLPAVSVRMDGSLAVQSNLPAFGEALRVFVSKIPAKPTTDQEFADTEAACKALKKAEEALEAAESGALASMADVEAMRRMVADFRDLARKTRLASEKIVTARKAEIREAEVARGKRALLDHLGSINAQMGGPYVGATLTRGDFAGCIKGLKTLDSLRNKIDTELAAAKAEANQIAARVMANLQTINAANMPPLFADKAQLVQKDPEAVAAIVAQRVAEAKAAEERRMEAERERIRAEEAARLEREARQREAAEHARLEAERLAEMTKDAPKPEDDDPIDVLANGLTVIETTATKSVFGLTAAAPEPLIERQDEPATLKGGDISARLGFTLQAAFIAETLGVPWRATDKAAKLWRESDFDRICAALVRHVEAVRARAE